MKTEKGRLGCLVLCGDRRFFPQTEEFFMEKTGLNKNDFWRNAVAGGAGGVVRSKDFSLIDHAVESGAEVIGWQMHGNHCGGFPGLSDGELKEKLREAIMVAKDRYPKAQHLGIWAQEGEEGVTVTVFEDTNESK